MPVKQYSCEKCNRSFRDAYALNRHLNSKKPCDAVAEAAEEVHCPVCRRTMSTLGNLKRHIVSKHPDFLEERAGYENQPGTMIANTETNNGTIANNITNNYNNNITINLPTEFGREDVGQLVQADWNKICGSPLSAKRDIVSALINYMNCSEERRMNHNVLVPEEDSENAYVYAQKNWRQRKCDETIRDCISNTALKAQDALVDTDFQKNNPTPKAKIDACLETLELMAEQADKADSSIFEEVRRIKSNIVEFTQKHPELLDVAVCQSVRAPDALKIKPSVVFRGYEPDGARRAELLAALQKGDSIPDLDLQRLSSQKQHSGAEL